MSKVETITIDEITITAPAANITVDGQPVQKIKIAEYIGAQYWEYAPFHPTSIKAGPIPVGSYTELNIRRVRQMVYDCLGQRRYNVDDRWVVTVDIMSPSESGVIDFDVHSSDPIKTPTGRKNKHFKSIAAAQRFVNRMAKKANS